MNNKVLLATSALVAAGFAAGSASAVDVEMYGQVNKALMVYDDGRDTETNITDNDFSSTRFGFKGSEALDNGLTASVLFEVEMQSNPSDTITQNTTATQSSTPAPGAAGFAERHARVGLGGDWGALFLGQMSTATDRVAEQDLAGVNDVLGSDVADIGGGVLFRTSTGTLTAYSPANTLNNFDGNGRADAIRYDSPIFNGFQLRASTAQGGDVDAGLFYKGKYDAFAIAGAIGYVANNDAAATTNIVEDQLSGSVSVKHDSGLGGTFAYGQQDLKNKGTNIDDPSFMYGKIGYGWDAFEVAIDYAQGDDQRAIAADHETTYVGVGAQADLGRGVSAAAFYKQFDVDVTGTNTDEINVYGVNLRAKF